MFIASRDWENATNKTSQHEKRFWTEKKHKILIIKKSNYWAINYDSFDNQMANDMFLGSF